MFYVEITLKAEKFLSQVTTARFYDIIPQKGGGIMEKTRAQILGENLERIRKEKGFSRKQLAEYLGVNVVAIGLYETGKREPPLDKIFKLATFFEISVSNLIGENDYNAEIPNIAAIVDKEIFKYRYERAMKIATDARFLVQENFDKKIFLTPPTEIDTQKGTAGEIKISVQYNIGFAPVLIKNRADFVQIMEDTESLALFNDMTFKQIFIERFYKKK